MFAICLHKHRILEESVITSVQEVSWLSAVSEKSFCSFFFKVTANLFDLEVCKILKRYHKLAPYIYFVLKKKLFENVSFLRSYCKFCVLRD